MARSLPSMSAAVACRSWRERSGLMGRGSCFVARMERSVILGRSIRLRHRSRIALRSIRATGYVLHLRRDQILHLHAVALFDDLRDPLPVALGMVALITEDAHRPRLVHQRRQLVELLLRLRRLQMRRIDLVQQAELAAARRLTAALRCPEALEMQIGNAALIETGRELILRKSRPPRGCNRANVDQKLDAGALQFIEHRLGRRLLIADGEETPCPAGHIDPDIMSLAQGYGNGRSIATSALRPEVACRIVPRKSLSMAILRGEQDEPN